MRRSKFDSKVVLVKKVDGIGFSTEDPSGQATQLADLNNSVGVRILTLFMLMVIMPINYSFALNCS